MKLTYEMVRDIGREMFILSNRFLPDEEPALIWSAIDEQDRSYYCKLAVIAVEAFERLKNLKEETVQ